MFEDFERCYRASQSKDARLTACSSPGHFDGDLLPPELSCHDS